MGAWGCVCSHIDLGTRLVLMLLLLSLVSSLVLGEGAACCGYTTLASEIRKGAEGKWNSVNVYCVHVFMLIEKPLL